VTVPLHDEDTNGGNKPPLARRLVDRALEDMRLYKTANRDSIAAVNSIEDSNGTQYYDVSDSSFSRWIDNLCIELTDLAPPRDAKKQALDTISTPWPSGMALPSRCTSG
jgi:hypothetical protein